MERIALNGSNVTQAAEKAAAVLRQGGVVLYPTDTLYGLGADALSDEAVAKIYAIKGRDEKKPMHAIVDGLEMAERFGAIDPFTRRLAKELPQGKISFIVQKKGFDSGILKGIGTFGFRMPDSDLCVAMNRALGGPITATSANRAGEMPVRDVDSILMQLKVMPDLAIDAGELPVSAPSTVIEMTQPYPMILREGAVPAADIWRVIADDEYF